ncbi:PREDICTED: protein PilJ-like, partial [Priapulus caudatus]|uniref:Protein PilJ-like n=1 Tax=Priapulus caudatus TaxID=37621 RepID=A0ABM1F7P4_PRICU
MLRDSRRREDAALENNRRNQRAILQLLDEMANLADGDLTVHTTVTEEITGAIADSVNFAIDALRTLVTTINSTAEEVSYSTNAAQGTAARLAESSNHQAREIASASAAITDMADSMEKVTGDASNSAEVAQKSMEIAQKGAVVVRNTISSMDVIRDSIQETSKRIKRLGESSQEIGDIVGLITEIADQTNILALNAAIQASTAGDAGRGFAVVADEVQRLAERAGNATKQIEGLVNAIQADTNEAVKSMETSTSGVVNGAKMAEES